MPSPTGKNEQFVLNWTRCEPRVFAYIYTLLPNWADAQDVLQETGILLWQKFEEFTSGTDFVRWACRVAYFEVQKHRHRERARKISLSDSFVDLLAERMNNSCEELQSVLAALGPCVERLKSPERKLIRMHYVLGASVKSVAAQLGHSREAAYKSLQRVRRKLFDCIHRALHQEELP